MAPNDVLPEPLPAQPLPLAAAWLAEAWQRADQPNPNAMVLATSDADGQPAARVVLCKGIVADPGYVHFVSNYHSRKGRELAANPRAALVFHWDHQHRQLRIEGLMRQSSAADSDTYFASRAWQSQLGAHASAQSQPIASRAALIAKLDAVTRQYGEAPGADGTGIPRPAHWGGYLLWVSAVELWVEGDARIHDRARWTRELRVDGAGQIHPGAWSATRLQP
jgi:pyridoxamine 5'-phosphate oxidase